MVAILKAAAQLSLSKFLSHRLRGGWCVMLAAAIATTAGHFRAHSDRGASPAGCNGISLALCNVLLFSLLPTVASVLINKTLTKFC